MNNMHPSHICGNIFGRRNKLGQAKLRSFAPSSRASSRRAATGQDLGGLRRSLHWEWGFQFEFHSSFLLHLQSKCNELNCACQCTSLLLSKCPFKRKMNWQRLIFPSTYCYHESTPYPYVGGSLKITAGTRAKRQGNHSQVKP